MRSDEDLALGVKYGSTDDLTTLVERHHSLLIGYLYRLNGGDRRLAEDLAQETFLRLIRSIEQYQYPRTFKPWLYAIATNLSRDHYKQADFRHTVSSSDEELDTLGQPNPQPEEAVIMHDELQTVAAALRALPQHQREVVILRYHQELSLSEIAEALAIPVGTVKSRLSLGLGRLRQKLEHTRHEN